MERTSLYRRSYDPRIRGLSNFSLSCCVNALLQSLFATKELQDLLDRWEPNGDCEESKNVALHLKKTLQDMRRDGLQPAPHRSFLACLHHNSIYRNVQHDADEVFLSVLNLIQQQMADTHVKREILDLYKVNIKGHTLCSECAYDHVVESFLLSLPLSVHEGRNDLKKCIQSFFEEQELEGEDKCYCERCGQKWRSKQWFELCALPKIVCMHLKRFRNVDGFTRKLFSKVSFPETLNFTDIDPKHTTTYRLYAVVVHSGIASFGHYTAYIQLPTDSTWYYADDSRVKKVSWSDVQRSYGGHSGYDTAYMLLYREQPEESSASNS
ncbi:ubl carboxyl-terminal hydrolase 18 [Engraulis encrasicolus]|uniref:ubl carboxyl-terminal hydrolase 18 n=1 Tax=Engraulis encrasicolus TaxID=184585 RepID=UPI002FD057A0